VLLPSGAQTFALVCKSQFLLDEKQRNTPTAVCFRLCAFFLALAPFPNLALELCFFYTAGRLLSTLCLLPREELEHEASKIKVIMCSDYNSNESLCSFSGTGIILSMR
jgi:hypothetical protein